VRPGVIVLDVTPDDEFEERPAELLGDVIKPIQIAPEIAEQLSAAMRTTDSDAERAQAESLQQLEHRRRSVLAKAGPGVRGLRRRQDHRRVLETKVGGVGG